MTLTGSDRCGCVVPLGTETESQGTVDEAQPAEGDRRRFHQRGNCARSEIVSVEAEIAPGACVLASNAGATAMTGAPCDASYGGHRTVSWSARSQTPDAPFHFRSTV